MSFISLWEIVEPLAKVSSDYSCPLHPQKNDAQEDQFRAWIAEFWCREDPKVRLEVELSRVSKKLHDLIWWNASDAPKIIDQNTQSSRMPSIDQTRDKFFTILRDLVDYAPDNQKARIEHLTVCQYEGKNPLSVPVGGNMRPFRAVWAARNIGFQDREELLVFLDSKIPQYSIILREWYRIPASLVNGAENPLSFWLIRCETWTPLEGAMLVTGWLPRENEDLNNSGGKAYWRISGDRRVVGDDTFHTPKKILALWNRNVSNPSKLKPSEWIEWCKEKLKDDETPWLQTIEQELGKTAPFLESMKPEPEDMCQDLASNVPVEVRLTNRELAERLEQYKPQKRRPSDDSLKRWREIPNDPLPCRTQGKNRYYRLEEVFAWYERHITTRSQTHTKCVANGTP